MCIRLLIHPADSLGSMSRSLQTQRASCIVGDRALVRCCLKRVLSTGLQVRRDNTDGETKTNINRAGLQRVHAALCVRVAVAGENGLTLQRGAGSRPDLISGTPTMRTPSGGASIAWTSASSICSCVTSPSRCAVSLVEGRLPKSQYIG